MKCSHCGRVDTDKVSQCVCYTWFVRTCAVCLATVIIGLACCIYCTCVLLSINKQTEVYNEKTPQGPLDGNGNQRVASKQVEETKSVEVSVADTSAIRTKRAAKKPKKRKEKRKGKKTQAAHFVLRKGLSDSGADCPPGSNTRHSNNNAGRTLDVFESATFINAKHNPFNVMNGRFIAKKKGLYLVYAQVLFEDCKAYEVMRIVQHRKVGNEEIVIQEHFCFVGVPKAKEGYNNTCSLTSLFYLEANDYLSVMNYYPEVHINYRSNSTFFGAVYLR